MTLLSEVVGRPGAFQALRELERQTSVTAFDPEDIAAVMLREGIVDPATAMQDFIAFNLLHQYGDRIGLTSTGIRTFLLLEAMNGGDLKETYRRLSRLDSTLGAYELVREGMTRLFLQNLNDRPGFGRLYFCSPWISLSPEDRGLLMHAVMHATGRGREFEVLFITRPRQGTQDAPPDGLQPFEELGATIFLVPRLHTKLYIREPDANGGYSMAILGSQNLTRSNYLELGIRVNADSSMIQQLITYFWDIANEALEA